ncbi:MAG: hypothetical protein JJ953_03930 [Gracilimonas sp.]|uniref:hypothetical protein n=1 Tax=Gracilimonas TaxID=649462 RepID=UPI001B19DC19|nr:hypothetical protein [Gracilimonas sp.]MBO6585235.1 hypothetical protein [Gracilimonas sp.]MBO6615493.1 hypothetical protein [Gracilimonas sp.]
MKKITVFTLLLICGMLLYSCENMLFSDEGGNIKAIQTDFEIGQPFELSYGGTATNTNESIRIEFTKVEDSRCPANVTCVWEGNGEVKLVTTIDDDELEVKLNTHSNYKKSERVNGITLKLLELNPYPESAEKGIPKKEYKAILLAEREE